MEWYHYLLGETPALDMADFAFTGETGGSSMTANELKIFAAWAAEHWDERGDFEWEYWSADRREDLAKMGVNASD
jgi:hypothetical protein